MIALRALRRWIYLIVVSSTIFALLLLLAGISLIATETGSGWLLNTVASDIKWFSIGATSGTLFNELTVNQLNYKDAGEFSVSIDEVHLQWNADDLLRGDLHIGEIQLDGININGYPVSSSDKKGKTEIPQIPIDISLDVLKLNQLSWQNDQTKTDINQLVLSAELVSNTLNISNLLLQAPGIQVKAQSNIQLQTDWLLDVEMDWVYQLDITQLNGSLAINGDRYRLNLDSRIKQPFESIQKGFLDLSGEQPLINIRGEWTSLQWPMSGGQQVNSNHGEFHLDGAMNNYEVRLNADATANEHVDIAIEFKGHGHQEGIQIDQLLIKPEHGQASINGDLSWAKAIKFNVQVNGRQLSPTDFGADFPGRLTTELHTKGRVDGDVYQAEIDIHDISGSIHGQPVHAMGALSLENQNAAIKDLQLSAGTNRLLANGVIKDQKLNLDLVIDAPDLSTAWPTLGGNISGEGVVGGSLHHPIIKSQLQARNIMIEPYRVGELKFDADYAPDRQSRIEISLRDVLTENNRIESIALQGSGTLANHQTLLDLHSSLTDVNLKIEGHWNDDHWISIIPQLTISHPQLQQWQLEKPAHLSLTRSQDSIDIDFPNSCLQQNNARVCMDVQGSLDQQLDANVLVTAWPLALTKPWLPEALTITGDLSAKAILKSRNKAISGSLSATVPKGKALFVDDDNLNHAVNFNSSLLTMQFQDDQFESQLGLKIGGQDFLRTTMTVGQANPSGVRQLSGVVDASIKDMHFVDGLFTDIRKVKGLLNVDLAIGGTTQQPSLVGTAEWKNGQFEIPRLGSELHHINVLVKNASDNQQRLLLATDIRSGQGALSAKGYLDLDSQQHFPMQLSLVGDNFQLCRLPEAEVVMSPNLSFDKLDNLTEVKGLIKIDHAKLEIKTLPENAIQPSNDEIIITSDQSEPKHSKPVKLNTKVSIDFGDNTRFSGFGLDSRLSGKLDYVRKNEKQRLQGRAELQDATYRSYGQDLSIRKGEFLFNGPADNPWLNVEAIRTSKSDKITAILGVTGSLKSPTTRIYSEPALPESEALAYLITGKSLKNAGKSDGNAIASAALSYGVGELSWLSEQLGIDEFEFEQGNTIEDSAVRLGQYLNPDLYVGVSVGLFASKYAVNIRYQLNEYFNLTTRASDTQRIELQYHLETD